MLLQKPLVRHPFSGLGVLAVQKFDRANWTGFYYRCLLYQDLSHWHHTRQGFGEHLGSVRYFLLKKRRNELLEIVVVWKGVEQGYGLFQLAMMHYTYLRIS